MGALGVKAAQRGLALIEEVGDPEHLHEQLLSILKDLKMDQTPQRTERLDSTVMAGFRTALELDFNSGRHVPAPELAHHLFPDLKQIKVKAPPTMPKKTAIQNARMRHLQAPANLGRNDPCWCGSGQKYKHCHRVADKQRH